LSPFRRLPCLLGLALSLSSPGWALKAEKPGWDGLPAEAMQALAECQDAYNALDFGKAEGLADSVVARWPEHPLPKIFLQGALLAEIQEVAAGKALEPALYGRFNQASHEAVQAAEERDREHRDAFSKLYLGGSLGTRAMGAMYRGQLLPAYVDGKKANAALKEAVKFSPELKEAYLGLGQYEYFCGRLAGVLRFLLTMPGDVKKGLGLLEVCGLEGGFAAIPARISLARVYCCEVTDFPRGLPYVREALERYPENYAFVRYALAEAQGLGLESPEAQDLCSLVFRRWDEGWRPPSYAPMNLDSLRLKAGETCLSQGKAELARSFLSPLTLSPNHGLAARARKDLAGLSDSSQ
jgi:tetratricopeptide (TPR) repeat protein